MPRRLIAPVVLLATIAAALAPAAAQARTRLYVHGRGFGHGVGMSQWGAYGYALHGAGYKAILRHYYTGMKLGSTDPSRTVRVLLEQGVGQVTFKGANRAGGRRLHRRRTYTVVRHGATSLDLENAHGREIATLPAPLRITGPGPIELGGTAQNGVTDGSYRGALEIRPETFQGVDAIDAVGLEDYVRGVVSAESPSYWPAAALEAQAVAARTYAITADVGGDGYDQYADTRSQMYKGVTAEYPSTDAAVAATRGQVVTYDGRPATTYFFSTSGGRTEDVQNSFIGSPPQPWLVSVKDPYDSYSPEHKWGPDRIRPRKLGDWVKGRFKRIEVLQRGASPRIVYADVVGTRGRTRVTGPELRGRLGLYDAWAHFTSIETHADRGHGSRARIARRHGHRHAVVAGHVSPTRGGHHTVKIRRRIARGRWVTARRARVHHHRFHARVSAPGRYRVRFRGVHGPSVRVR